MIKVTRRVTRETAEVDGRTGQPVIVSLEPGGRLIRLRAKGSRTYYTVTIRQAWVMGAHNAAQDLKRRKSEAKEQRKQERKV